MIRFIKICFFLFNLLACTAIAMVLLPMSKRLMPYAIYALFFSLFVYIFGGLEKAKSRSVNEMLFSYGISFIISSLVLFASGGILSERINLSIYLLLLIYSLVALPLIVHSIYQRFFSRLPSKNLYVIGDKLKHGVNIDKITKYSLFKLNIKGYFNDLNFQKDAGFLPQSDIIVSAQPNDLACLQAKERSLLFLYLPRMIEEHTQKIPLDLIRENENYYLISFEDRGVQPITRVFDWLISIIILFFSFPILVLSAILIKTIDRSEIIFCQDRRGYRGRMFKMYKLATMKKESNGSDYKVSILGNILRKLRINEIPQLWNVISGDMSIVGPRPDIESTYRFCMNIIPYYHYRTNVLPGITGHAQIHFKYLDVLNVSNFSERLAYDLYFVKNNSIYIYFITLMKTVGSVILMKGK